MKIEKIINDTFKDSFNLFKKEYVTFILGTLLAILLSVFVITMPPLMFGVYLMASKLSKGKKIEITDVFKGFSYFFTSWGMFILAAIAITIGLVLLVIPGIILMILFQYAIVIAIKENKGAISALKKSYAVGKKHFVFSVALWILLIILNGIAQATYVGVLLTIPFSALVLTTAASKLK
ncbi:glycerophosphodiester phosphodiesterase [Candidatus Woesearchaeota archaeon]|jgi:hypothetical protein|nr:glycerophosphodiester phosphodiesterase [Candidatus Woesearchaeota archaeon]